MVIYYGMSIPDRFPEITITVREEQPMVTYVCLGLLFLFVLVKALGYRAQGKRALSHEQLDKLVFSILKSSGQRDRE
jgi:hypothetical protein